MSLPRLLPRYLSLRALAPRITPPILPLTTRVGAKELTRTPRISATRLFHISPASRLSQSRISLSNSASHEPLPPNATLSQRLKHLMRAYGWYAIGVYAVVSIIDFGTAFIGIHLLGAEYVSSIVAVVKQWVFSTIHYTPSPEPAAVTEQAVSAGGREGVYAILVLAYAVHKTIFLPVRIGVTATCTPRIVNWLRARGWAGSSGTRTAIQNARERIRRND